MSEKQNAFIVRLVSERWQSLGAESKGAAIGAFPLDQMTSGQKSQLIDKLLNMPNDPDPDMPEAVANASRNGSNDSPGMCEGCGHPVPRDAGYYYGPHNDGKRWRVHHKVGKCSSEPAPEQIEVREGVYVTPSGDYVQAYRTKNGRIGGKVWNGRKFEYVKGAIHQASLGHRITAGEAKAFGLTSGRCIFCQQTLTDGRSTEVGYGPVCADTNGLPWG